MSISYNSITACVGNVQVPEENTSENSSVYKVSGETDAIGKDIPFSCSLYQTYPPATKGKYIKIKYCMQLPTDLPQFVFFANLPQYIKDPYRRFVENKLREKFNFEGVPLDIFFREK